MNHKSQEFEQAEELVRKVLPAFDVSPSPDFRAQVLARAETLSASRHRGYSWGMPTWAQQWVPALTVGLALVALMVWSPLPLGLYSRERSPEQVTTGTQRRTSEEEIPRKAEETLHLLMEKGRKQFEEGKVDEARVTFLEAVDQVAAPLNALAWLAYVQDDAEAGLPHARLAVQLFPENAAYQDTLATSLCTLGRQEEAVEVMKQAARLQREKYLGKLDRFHQGICR